MVIFQKMLGLLFVNGIKMDEYNLYTKYKSATEEAQRLKKTLFEKLTYDFNRVLERLGVRLHSYEISINPYNYFDKSLGKYTDSTILCMIRTFEALTFEMKKDEHEVERIDSVINLIFNKGDLPRVYRTDYIFDTLAMLLEMDEDAMQLYLKLK